jgi:Phosphatase-1 catalytic subunit binding region
MSFVTVPNVVEWAEDYVAARRGSWVQDRLHFDRRIKDTEEHIGWVFSASHRIKIISSLQKL